MDVACSTLCYSRMPLVAALRVMAELEFDSIDLAVADEGTHIATQEVIQDPLLVMNQLKQGPTLTFSAITLRTPRKGADFEQCLDGVAHFAKQIAAPTLVVEAASASTPLDVEVERLKRLVGIASRHGAVLTVSTQVGTLTENPQVAVDLCENVEGLALTLDPSHYIAGPHQGDSYEMVFPYVHHTHLRDSGRRLDQLQVKVGRGEIEYGKLINSLFREAYRGALTVSMEESLGGDMDIPMEVRKLRLLLESYLIQRDTSVFRSAA